MTHELEIIFDTVKSSRKFQNLMSNSVVRSWLAGQAKSRCSTRAKRTDRREPRWRTTTGGKADRPPPLCTYPEVAVYKETGSSDAAANFSCSVSE